MNRAFVHPISVVIVAVTFLFYVAPTRVQANSLPRGSESADKAARAKTVTDQAPVFLAFAPVQPDTTETFEFPDEDQSHLYRDIAIFLIASAFVAYAIALIFFQTEDNPNDDDGNDRPTPDF